MECEHGTWNMVNISSNFLTVVVRFVKKNQPSCFWFMDVFVLVVRQMIRFVKNVVCLACYICTYVVVIVIRQDTEPMIFPYFGVKNKKKGLFF